VGGYHGGFRFGFPFGVPGTGLGARATGFGEAGVAEGADEQRQAAAVFHRLQLADIADQDHLERRRLMIAKSSECKL
jgi:hypothetical protein